MMVLVMDSEPVLASAPRRSRISSLWGWKAVNRRTIASAVARLLREIPEPAT